MRKLLTNVGINTVDIWRHHEFRVKAFISVSVVVIIGPHLRHDLILVLHNHHVWMLLLAAAIITIA